MGLDYFIENLRFDLVMMMVNNVGCMNLNLLFCCCCREVLVFDLRDFDTGKLSIVLLFRKISDFVVRWRMPFTLS